MTAKFITEPQCKSNLHSYCWCFSPSVNQDSNENSALEHQSKYQYGQLHKNELYSLHITK